MRTSAGTTSAKEAGRQNNDILPMVVLLLHPDCSEKRLGREGRENAC